MRVLHLIVFFIGLLFYTGCKPKATMPTAYENTIAMPGDSIKKREIQQQIEAINKTISEKGPPVRFSFPVINPTDSVAYWVANGKPARISLSMHNGEGIQWPTFFFVDDQLIHVRYRVLVKTNTEHYASETMTYLKDGKIVYAEDRKISLSENQTAALLRQHPYVVSNRTFSDLEKEFASYWAKVKPAVDSHFVHSATIQK